jgi:peptide chain release factor 1
MSEMLEKISGIEEHYHALGKQLEQADMDYQRAAELAKERSGMEEVVMAAQQYRGLLERIQQARELQGSDDAEMNALAQAELDELEPQVSGMEARLKSLLIPKDPRDDRNVIVEIRAGTGGDEAGLFAADLARIYTRYAERRGWKIEVLSQSETGIGGYKEMVMLIKGKGAYSKLKYESGVHRVQRVPATEASGRIHTSTITVAVLAEVEDVDIQIPESDIRTDVFRSSGAGGQNVQKNATAVRITHLPTGIVVACQDERSQLQNRLRAMSILRARLYEMEEEKRLSERDESRRTQVGTGERSEKIRTYNFPQSRVTDHRVNVSSFNISAVLDGDLDVFIDELSLRDESDRLSAAGMEDDD